MYHLLIRPSNLGEKVCNLGNMSNDNGSNIMTERTANVIHDSKPRLKENIFPGKILSILCTECER